MRSHRWATCSSLRPTAIAPVSRTRSRSINRFAFANARSAACGPISAPARRPIASSSAPSSFARTCRISVVSGINRGANAGDDITYSGTIAAANESLLVGVPAIAVSLAIAWPISHDRPHWHTAAHCALDLAAAHRPSSCRRRRCSISTCRTCRPRSLRGVKLTKQARKRYTRPDRPPHSIRAGESYVWIWGSHNSAEIEEGTDLAALRDGYASVTPITIDRTDEVIFEDLRERL